MPVPVVVLLQTDDGELNLVEFLLRFFIPVETVAAENCALDGLSDKRQCSIRIQQESDVTQPMVLCAAHGSGDKDLYIFPAVVARTESSRVNGQVPDAAARVHRREIVGFQALILKAARDTAHCFLDGRPGEVMERSL